MNLLKGSHGVEKRVARFEEEITKERGLENVDVAWSLGKVEVDAFVVEGLMLQAESFEEFNLEDAIALVVEIFFEERLNDVLGGEGFEVALDEDI